MIIIFAIFVFQFISAFVGFLQSVNQWYDNGQVYFYYDYTSLFYGIVFSILWLFASIFTQLVSQGKFNNDEFFIRTLEMFMILLCIFIFSLFFIGSVKLSL